MLIVNHFVFLDARMVDSVIQAEASIMQVLYVSRILGEWQTCDELVLSKGKVGQDHNSILVWFDITCWPNSKCCTEGSI